MRLSLSTQRMGSVSQDWRSPLGPEKSSTYSDTLRQLETSYAMFSINLDEAIGLRRSGRLGKAYQSLSLTPALCKRLARALSVVLQAMLAHSRHFGTSPNLSPLDPDNFQHPKSRRAASFSNLASRIFLSRRSQFLSKISTLIELVEDLDTAYLTATHRLADSATSSHDREWDLLDASHYDLNTCLRESIVLLKCFLHALPEQQLNEFHSILHTKSSITASILTLPKRNLAHRRMALLKGQ